ncbi:MAG: hypothetical protein IT378_01235, partial [Sandaracinaceae bacterium]|nr:hypothetical protein [Sandaracinaceae bacterium]
MQRLRELTTAVRRRLIVRAALSALGDATVVVGAVALVVALAAPWLPRWPAILIVAIISIVLLARARRALPTQSELVLFVDRKLEAGEAIVTAYELGSDPPELQRATIARAEAVLAGASAKEVRPAIDPRRIAILPFAALVFAAALVIPTPRVAIGARPDTVHVREAEALRRVERLVPEARDPEQRRRLEEAARHAEALRRELERGMERREAFDRLASLRDEVERARRQETPRERDARERASHELSGEPEMQRALDAQDDAALDRAV